jgi:hypothetical protein
MPGAGASSYRRDMTTHLDPSTLGTPASRVGAGLLAIAEAVTAFVVAGVGLLTLVAVPTVIVFGPFLTSLV